MLHAAVSALFAWLCRNCLGLSKLSSLLTASLFAIHPIHTEAVTTLHFQTAQSRFQYFACADIYFFWLGASLSNGLNGKSQIHLLETFSQPVQQDYYIPPQTVLVSILSRLSTWRIQQLKWLEGFPVVALSILLLLLIDLITAFETKGDREIKVIVVGEWQLESMPSFPLSIKKTNAPGWQKKIKFWK